MRKIISFTTILFCQIISNNSFCQTTATKNTIEQRNNDSLIVFDLTEVKPSFPGGTEGWKTFLQIILMQMSLLKMEHQRAGLR